MTSRRSRTLEFDVVADIADLQKKLNQAARETEGFAKKFDRVGTSLTRNVTLPMAGLGVVATKAASDLGEATNAVTVVFGEASEKVLEFGNNSAEAVGLSKRAFLQLATPLGAVFQNFGDDADTAARKTIELTQRAADMASVFNVDVSEALGAIQAALRGEADPIERFGVSVNAAAVSAKALELGLADTATQITDADKATARYALIMEQTARVQGDFANTSDSLANKTRILKADAEDLAAEFGAALLPIMEDVVGVVGNVAEAFGSLSPEMQETIVKMALLAAAAGPAAKVLGGVGTAAAATATAIKGLNLLVAGAGGLVPALKALGTVAAPLTAVVGVLLGAEAAGNKLATTVGQNLDPSFGELNVQIEDLLSPGRWPRFIESLREAADGTEDAERATTQWAGSLRDAEHLTAQQRAELERFNAALERTPDHLSGPIPAPDISEFEGRIARASEIIRNFAREQLALVDPVLARALAEQRAADAQERYSEVTKDTEASERDREKAAIDVLVAEAELDAATRDLSDSIDGPLIDAFDAMLERTGLLREDFRFLIDDLREFQAQARASGVFITSDGRPIPVRDLERELVRRGQAVVE